MNCKDIKRDKRDAAQQELQRFKRDKRDAAEQELKRYKRHKRDVAEQELKRFKRSKRDMQPENSHVQISGLQRQSKRNVAKRDHFRSKGEFYDGSEV